MSVEDCYVACCEAKKFWYQSDDSALGNTFAGYLHDDDCVNYEPIEVEDDVEADYDDAFSSVFGNVEAKMSNLTIRSEGL